MPGLQWALAAVLAAGAGCAGDMTRERVAGVYVMRGEWPADTLELHADGRFVRTFAERNRPATVDSGPWFLSRDGRTVGLREFPQRRTWGHDVMFDTTGGAIFARPSTVALAIGRTWTGRVRLAWRSEVGWRYERLRDDRREPHGRSAY